MTQEKYDRYEVRLSGSGGQGLILAGIILAEAAAIYDDKNAVQTQSYGPEARGGASKSEVIISDSDIDYPKAIKIDALVALTQESCNKYSSDLRDSGVLIADSHFVKQLPSGKFKIYKLPILETARDKVGRELVANIVSLGVLVEITKAVTKESIEKAVLARVPKGTEELNKKALHAGYELVKKKG